MLRGVFGVGTWEMAVIAVVALLLFSPRELPKMLRQVTRFWAQLRATADEFHQTILHADGVDEIKELVNGTRQQIRGVEDEARREMMKARAQMRKAQQKLAMTNKAKQERRKAETDATPKPTADDGPQTVRADEPEPSPAANHEAAVDENNQGAA